MAKVQMLLTLQPFIDSENARECRQL